MIPKRRAYYNTDDQNNLMEHWNIDQTKHHNGIYFIYGNKST